jgi:hypothetical protein
MSEQSPGAWARREDDTLIDIAPWWGEAESVQDLSRDELDEDEE